MTLRSLLGMTVGLLLMSGCASSPYAPGYSYYPQPASVDVYKRGSNQSPPLTVLVSILGVHNADPAHRIPYSVVVRMRFEAVGPAHVTFDPRSLDLVTGTLRAFEPAIADPSSPIDLAPSQRQDVTVYFPFPRNTKTSQMDMRNLRLRWQVKIDNYPVPQTALFERVPGGYDDVDSDVYY